MQTLQEALLESWDRQCQIVDNLANRITPDLLDAKSREGEFPIGEHLCHIHGTRRFWLSKVAPEFADGIPSLYTKKSEEEWIPSGDLPTIKKALAHSAGQIRHAMEHQLSDPEAQGQEVYDHPVFFLQHMIWHEGWHVSSIMQALRAVGQEPPEEWEEPNIWGVWRTEPAWE
jgi:uncharacterized damage-inducible protein DinB